MEPPYDQAQQDPRQLVLPLAVSELHLGPFAALRSQNYSDFLGHAGRTFQDGARRSNGGQHGRWMGG